MNDAKANEEADAKKKEAVDTRNEADQLIFQTEKTLEEVGDKLVTMKSQHKTLWKL